MKLLRYLLLFGKSSAGTILSPYVTYRSLAFSSGNLPQTVFIYFLIFIYFLLSSLLKNGLANPYLLTLRLNLLIFAFLMGLATVLMLFYLGAKIFKTEFNLGRIFKLWSFSFWPTLIWFTFTSVMSVILPPPRSLTLMGKTYSFVYLALSLTLLFWKLILYYLTLRFALKFDLFKIIFYSFISFPILLGFSLLMYSLRIFKIPFI